MFNPRFRYTVYSYKCGTIRFCGKLNFFINQRRPSPLYFNFSTQFVIYLITCFHFLQCYCEQVDVKGHALECHIIKNHIESIYKLGYVKGGSTSFIKTLNAVVPCKM